MKPRGVPNRRAGITLLEILLVTAIVALIASLALPSMSRTLVSQKLEKAADVVRAEMGRARVQAIRSGKVVAFVYNLGQSQLAVKQFDQLVQAGTVEHFREGKSDENRSSDLDFSEQNLPRGIRFVAGEALADVRSEFETAAAGGSAGKLKPILFYPDGTSQEAQVVLANEKGDAVRIVLRGLTGTSRKVQLEE